MRHLTHRTATLLLLAAALPLMGCEATHQRIAASDLPPQVVAGFDSEYPGAAIRSVKKETYKDGQVHYELGFITSEGRTIEREFTPEGRLLPEH
jgi:hypothetical protein